ncbi:MAG: zinc ribbon domain-containing protein [Gemmatimonadales bacterium]|nr:zinc ribbon domain-containing protein [Gemmatimonadales bacterium]
MTILGHMTRDQQGAPASSHCPACGAQATGKFCHQCGSALGPRNCASCGTPLEATARFCHRCGAAAGAGPTPAAGSTAPAAGNLPWIVAASIILVAVAAIVWKVAGPAAPAPAGGGIGVAQPAAGAPPDISQMSPIERFIRLNDRIMTAAEAGDTATVQSFLPMALSAYAQLPEVDTDSRYHAALLHAEAGDLVAARAISDSILGAEPANLIGLVLRGALAERAGDSATLAEARRRFQAAWAAEIDKPKPEYQDHRNVLDAFRAAAGQ